MGRARGARCKAKAPAMSRDLVSLHLSGGRAGLLLHLSNRNRETLRPDSPKLEFLHEMQDRHE